MGHHYVGTVEIKVGLQVKGVWHRFGALDNYTEYWMLLDGFHMWNDNSAVDRSLNHLGPCIPNNDIGNFRQFALVRLGLSGQQNPPIEFWRHNITRAQ